MILTVGSLCTGTAQYERALTLAGVDTEVAFVADPDPGASALLAHHYPDVPNLGDITAVDWTRVRTPDILTAGYPCQGFSLAGQRLGENDERFIWPHVFAAVRDLRPRVLLLENVPGHLSLGFGRVLGDLASIGYDANWTCVRASDVGAAHRRERVFILAWQEGDDPGAVLGVPTARAGRSGGDGAVLTGPLLKTPTAQLAINGGSQHPDKRKAGGHGPTLADQVEHLLPTPRASDGEKGGPNQRGSKGDLMLPSAVMLLPTPTVADSRGTRNATSGRKDGSEHPDGWTLGDIAFADRWGDFAPAISRWESVIGRPAPEPTEPGRNGQPRLAVRFVEWLMGNDDGHVTGVPGLTRNQQLRLLGNEIVALQGALAVHLLAGVA